ncbi:MAG TPA: hypothetical protein VGE81_08090, partial [Candidatus Limnocylindrales bacterium]
LIVAAASEVVALVDHTKWGRTAFATFCPLDNLTAVVTDEEAPADMTNGLRRRRISVHIAPGLDKTVERRAGRHLVRTAKDTSA